MFSFCLVGSIFVTDNYQRVSLFSCKEPVEPLSLDEVADRCHAPEDVNAIFSVPLLGTVSHIQVKASLTLFFFV
jgi:hypothetical protein